MRFPQLPQLTLSPQSCCDGTTVKGTSVLSSFIPWATTEVSRIYATEEIQPQFSSVGDEGRQ